MSGAKPGWVRRTRGEGLGIASGEGPDILVGEDGDRAARRRAGDEAHAVHADFEPDRRGHRGGDAQRGDGLVRPTLPGAEECRGYYKESGGVALVVAGLLHAAFNNELKTSFKNFCFEDIPERKRVPRAEAIAP